ncbi:MAG: PAS domain-containing protein, partial [Desulfohalobiaceae bacterium]|nr:PAS domain-containing protein [Desulfohalobiaceae bacterium]
MAGQPLKQTSFASSMSTFSDWETIARSLFDLFPHPAFVFNAQGLITQGNQTAADQLQLAPGGGLELLQPDMWQEIAKALDESPGGTTLAHQDTTRTSLFRIQAIPVDREDLVFLCVGEDRSEESQFIESLENSEQIIRELESIIESSPDGIWICDEQARVIKLNPASERNNSIKTEEAIGRTMEELLEQGYIDCSATLEVLKHKKPISLLQTTKENNKLLVTGNPIFDRNGELIRIITNERNIGDFEQLKDELEQEKARHHELSHHLNELQQSEFISKNIVAHSANMINALRQAVTIGPTKTTVLIQGE